jgi:hypothetical protein
VLKPLGKSFDFVAGKVGVMARDAGEAVGPHYLLVTEIK